MTGQRILNYRIDYLIGEGGMGSVYLATHVQLGRKVAIKALNASFLKNTHIRERFKNEASALAQLQHPSIVTLYDYVEEENGLYLVMEYVAGKPLNEYIQTDSGPIPEAKAVALLAKVLDGVAYAHERGVVHRDIKPANIMITPDGNAKILDFGIAKLISQSASLTRTGMKMGTVLYMSPEQVKGEPADHRSDVYSLGVTLFQMLTGRPPYDEFTSTEFVIYNQIVNEPLPPASQWYPGVSSRLQAVLDKATAKNPANRFQNCTDFRDALLGNPESASSARTKRLVNTWTETNPSPEPAFPPPNINLGVWIGIIAALVLVVTVVFWNRGSDSPAEKERPVATSPKKSSGTEKKTTENDAPTNTDEAEPNEPKSDETNEPETKPLSAYATELITLNYEVPDKLFTDSSDPSSTNRFTVRMALRNISERVNFDNVTLKISYLNDQGQVIGNYLYEHGYLAAGATERFLVERTVPSAVNVTCRVISANPLNVSASDSLE